LINPPFDESTHQQLTIINHKWGVRFNENP